MSFTPAWALLKKKCSSESCCCIGSTFGVPIPTVDTTKKNASKKIRRGDPDILTLWLEKVAIKLKVIIIISHRWRGTCSYSNGMPSLPSSLIPLLIFPVPNPRMSYCGIQLRPELPRIAYERLRIHPNRSESIKIQLRCIRMHNELVTN